MSTKPLMRFLWLLFIYIILLKKILTINSNKAIMMRCVLNVYTAWTLTKCKKNKLHTV